MTTPNLVDQFDAIGRIHPNAASAGFLAPRSPQPVAAEPSTGGPNSLVQALMSLAGKQTQTLASDPAPDVGPGRGDYGAQLPPSGHQYGQTPNATSGVKTQMPDAIAQRGFAP